MDQICETKNASRLAITRWELIYPSDPSDPRAEFIYAVHEGHPRTVAHHIQSPSYPWLINVTSTPHIKVRIMTAMLTLPPHSQPCGSLILFRFPGHRD